DSRPRALRAAPDRAQPDRCAPGKIADDETEQPEHAAQYEQWQTDEKSQQVHEVDSRRARGHGRAVTRKGDDFPELTLARVRGVHGARSRSNFTPTSTPVTA